MGDGGTDRDEFISRIGTFFLLMGTLFMILFVASDLAKDPYFRYFFLAAVAILVGVFFKRITAKPPKPGARFSGIRGWMQKRREAAKKKKK